MALHACTRIHMGVEPPLITCLCCAGEKAIETCVVYVACKEWKVAQATSGKGKFAQSLSEATSEPVALSGGNSFSVPAG